MHTQDLDDLHLEEYLMPELILPVQSSRGCYWKKCTFCDHDFGQTYNVKNVKKMVSELQELNSKYGIKHFEFIDEAMSGDYIRELSEAILDSGLEINWYCNARLENSFTKDVFVIARKAGLRMILWGLESGSERIMALINKGVDFEKRPEILKNASDADIWNYAYIFFGFPSETHEDVVATADLICNNLDIIHYYGRSMFTLGKHAQLSHDPEKFGIIKLPDDEEFSATASFTRNKGLSQKELEESINLFRDRYAEISKDYAWRYMRYREILFMYICKYGKDSVLKMKIK